MYYDGLSMLDHFGYPAPVKRGVFRFSSEQEVKAFLAHAAEIRLGGKIREIKDNEARNRLGVFFQPGRFLFEVLDAPFPEADLMETARARATAAGARFQQCRASLERDSSAKNGYVVVADDQRIAPITTIVCAGAGTPKLLRALNLPHPLAVQQSVLLVIDDATAVRVPLLADRTTGLTVVSWNARECPPRGRLVVGAGEKRLLLPEDEDLRRRTLPSEEAFLLSLLPKELDVNKRMHRFTPGQKTDVLVNGRPTIAPWIHAPEEFPGLIFGTPGKATLAFVVAQHILSQVEVNESNGATGLDSGRGPDEPLPGPRWKARIRAHFEDDYDLPSEKENKR
jgi:glycine/D-amino acid oxidase-like deaminating enzyme